MTQSQVLQTIHDADTLLATVVDLYNQYFDTLERCMEHIPDTETELIAAFTHEAEEAEKALEHDLSVFERAITSDREDVTKVKDQLQIQSIYQQLKH